jgi:hypothetical protein
MSARNIVFIFGMGRSGTSMLTRILSLCGASLPDRLMGSSDDNPKGYWEPLDALDINDAFLFRHGATWYDPTLRLQGEIALPADVREGYVRDIASFLEGCPRGPVLVVKDPRIAGLSDFWFEASLRAGYAIKIVVPIRHPDEVAASLATRNGASAELSGVLWLKYNLLAELKSRPFARVFVEYSNVLGDWRQQMRRIADHLAIELKATDEPAIDAFVDQNLRRQRRDGVVSNCFGEPWTARVYAALSAAGRDTPIDRETLDAVFAAFRACERTFRISLDEFRTRFGPPSSDGSAPP